MPRDRIIQGPVIAERGAIPRLATLRRWGAFKRMESRLEHTYGRDVAEQILRSNYGYPGATPIAGFPASTCDGCIVPRISGGAGGFTDLADLRTKTLGGRGQYFRVEKTGLAATTGDSRNLFARPTLPPQGGNSGTTTAGTVYDRTSTGALGQQNALSGEKLYFVGCQAFHSTPCCVIMYDHLWGINRDISLGSLTGITGIPSRYATTSALGNWIATRVTTATSATTSSWGLNVGDYTGAAFISTGLILSNASGAVFDPLIGTTMFWQNLVSLGGIAEVEQLNWGSGAQTGNFDVFIGHNIACIPCIPAMGVGNAGLTTFMDGPTSAFNFMQVLDGACLAFNEFSKSAGGQAGQLNIDNLLLVSA